MNRQFTSAQRNDSWVTDITFIKTHEGWLYLAVVLDLFSRKVVGWSMHTRITKELVLEALLMAVWRRKPKVTVHSDQGSQCYQPRLAIVSKDSWTGRQYEPSRQLPGQCGG